MLYLNVQWHTQRDVVGFEYIIEGNVPGIQNNRDLIIVGFYDLCIRFTDQEPGYHGDV